MLLELVPWQLRSPLPSRSNSARRGGPHNTTEGGAFHVARCGAGSSVPQAVAHGAQFADRPVQLLRLGREHLPVDARLPFRREHERISSSEKPAARPSAISASRSSTPASNWRRNPRLPLEAISPFSS